MHLYLDVTSAGSLKLNHPDRAIEELEETCALDVADQGAQTLIRIGRLMNVSTARADQMVQSAAAEALAKVNT
jgi:hypothetical protein